jgi:hypothetical protein
MRFPSSTLNVMNTRIKERRNCRHDCLVPIEAKTKSAFGNAQTIDISQGGLGLILKQAIPVGQTIAVELDLAPEQDPVLVVGEVRWVRKLFGSTQYRAGILFKKILVSPTPHRLRKYLSK